MTERIIIDWSSVSVLDDSVVGEPNRGVERHIVDRFCRLATDGEEYSGEIDDTWSYVVGLFRDCYIDGRSVFRLYRMYSALRGKDAKDISTAVNL